MALSLSAGADRELEELAARSGANVMVVKAGLGRARAGFDLPQGWYPATTLRETDVLLLRNALPDSPLVIPISESAAIAAFAGKRVAATVRGTGLGYLEARNFKVQYGRAFNQSDMDSRRRVAIIGQFVAIRLGANADLLGKQVAIANVPFEVVGILAEKGLGFDGSNEDEQIVLPIGTALSRLQRRDYLSSILLKINDSALVAQTEAHIRDLLRAQHRLHVDTHDDFEILSATRESESKRVRRQMFSGLSAIFASLTAVIGSVGILTVLFLNIRSRVGEIGLRRAIGARRSDIVFLFLVEACVLSGLGGAVGVVCGVLTVLVLERSTDWQMSLGALQVGIPFAASCVIGLLAGILPAASAARLAPVTALKTA